MAGPSLLIVLPTILRSTARTRVFGRLEAVADRFEGDDFWVSGRPFVVSFGQEYPGQLSELFSGEQNLPWAPQDMLVIGAMCNSSDDHRILASIAEEVARLLGGFVGLFPPLETLCPGEIPVEHPYVAHLSTCDLLSPDGLAVWRKHPCFALSK